MRKTVTEKLQMKGRKNREGEREREWWEERNSLLCSERESDEQR